VLTRITVVFVRGNVEHLGHRRLRLCTGPLAGIAALQVGLGVGTLLFAVPIGLALAHQALALVLFGAAVAHLRASRRERGS